MILICKPDKNIELHRRRLEAIVDIKNLTDEQIIAESKQLDELLNKRNYKCFNCKEKCKRKGQKPLNKDRSTE